MNRIIKFKGKPISEMSREELIEALEHAVDHIEELYRDSQKQRDFIFEILEKPKERRVCPVCGSTECREFEKFLKIGR